MDKSKVSQIENSSNFFENLQGFSKFQEISSPLWYHPVPQDWCVVVADVEGSTKAIEQGQYKNVNAVGVASIVAVLNVLKPLRVPYVFGGDGATFVCPMQFLEKITSALAFVKKMALEQFELSLRVGFVGIEEIRQAQRDVLIAKYQPSSHFQQAMFSGGGLGFAEKIVKNSALDHPCRQLSAPCADPNLFGGFECRWNEIPSPHGENLTLIVQVLADNIDEQQRLYAQFLKEIQRIYGEDHHHHPLREKLLILASSRRLLSAEAKIKTVLKKKQETFKALLKLKLLCWLGKWLMLRKVKTEHTDWGQYKQQLILNTDYRKFDEILRMVISGTKEQRLELCSILEKAHSQGKIAYGIHVSTGSLITCMVKDYDKDHLHFLDGSNGGYAMAAKKMKEQIKMMVKQSV
jgi:hypothetical protein